MVTSAASRPRRRHEVINHISRGSRGPTVQLETSIVASLRRRSGVACLRGSSVASPRRGVAGPRVSRRAGQTRSASPRPRGTSSRRVAVACPRRSLEVTPTRMAPRSIPSAIIYVMLDVESLTGVIEAVMVAVMRGVLVGKKTLSG